MTDIIEFPPGSADVRFDEMPESGDIFIHHSGNEMIITGVHVVNKSKIVLKTEPKREVKRFADPTDASWDWERLPEKFLKDSSPGFVEAGAFKAVKEEND